MVPLSVRAQSLTNMSINELVEDFDHDFEKGHTEDEIGDIYLLAL